MDLRLATTADMPRVERLYRELIEYMKINGPVIWNDIYPFEVLGNDLAARRLYLLEDAVKLQGVFALSQSNVGERAVAWEAPDARCLYLDRLAVSKDCLRTGVGSVAVELAIKKAHELGAEYLRLFVVDYNEPALCFYRKLGFQTVAGEFYQHMTDGRVLREFGMEIRTKR